MDPADLDADTSTWIAAQLTAAGVDRGYLPFVVRHLTEPDDNWRWCCGSSCDPCVRALGRVVDTVRRSLAVGPGGDAAAGSA
jgi:hypothetical protein